VRSRAVIEPLFAEAISAGQVPAIAGAAARRDDVGSAAVGEAELERRPVDPRTPFRAYSVSKPFTALAVVCMHLEGRFELDDSANHHLQSLEVLDPSGRPAAVPIRALLTHTVPLEPAVMAKGLAGCPRRFTDFVGGRISCLGPSGVSWAYSNEGYGVLQQLVEDVANTDFGDYMNDFLSRFGIEDGGFFEPPGPPGAAIGYDRGGGGWRRSPDMYPPLAAGGLWLSALDQERLLLALSRPDHEHASAVAMATQPQVRMPMPELKMGLGFMLREYAGRTFAWHNGASVGGYAELWLSDTGSVSYCGNASVDLASIAERAIGALAAPPS
jgi:CubicO group peptidase (beta-lactamase class C family)